MVSDVSDFPSSASVVGSGRGAVARELGRVWWLLLIVGIVWVLFGMFILSYRVGSLLALAVLAGVTFLLGGVAELLAAVRAPSWKWLYALAGIMSVIAGVVAFIWPGIT